MGKTNKLVKIWLIVGLIMLYFQIIIGGITRLTGSGLSITEWDIVTGTFPPLDEASWISMFEKYKSTPQYEKINLGMEMGSIFEVGSFKFIYFWEYLHRVWARSMGFVFLFPFVFFYWRGWIPKSLAKRLIGVILLAALAATFGWIMVASGLVNRPWVNAYKLALHLCIGISVFAALWWAYIRYTNFEQVERILKPSRYLNGLLCLIFLQIFLGGVMSGTKAALFINTWPDFDGVWIPDQILVLDNWSADNFNHYEKNGFVVSLIQFLHRGIAYVILIISGWIFWRERYWSSGDILSKSFNYFIALLFVQSFLGIMTLIKSIGMIPVYWGVLHQGVAVLVLAVYLLHLFHGRYKLAY